MVRQWLDVLARAGRARHLMGATKYIVLSNYLRSGIADFVARRPGGAATLDEIVEYYLATSAPADPEDIQLLIEYCREQPDPDKPGYVRFLIDRASWVAPRRAEVKFQAPPPEDHDWAPAVRALHVRLDPRFPLADPVKRAAATAHWHHFLVMAAAFGLVRYENRRARVSPREQARWAREMEIFGDGYFGVDDLLGVLLKVEVLRAETGWIVRPPPFMLESCDAMARRAGLDAYWRFSPRLTTGRSRVLDLGCGSGIYSNAFADRGNECVAVDATPWVFYRAFLGAHPKVRVVCADMNALPETVTRQPYTHVISNIAAHHFRNRPALFAAWREMLAGDGEICVLNFDYSLHHRSKWNPIARMKEQFAAKIQYNWTVLEFDRGGVQFISPQDVARELESAGFAATVHRADPAGELFLVRGTKRA